MLDGKKVARWDPKRVVLSVDKTVASKEAKLVSMAEM